MNDTRELRVRIRVQGGAIVAAIVEECLDTPAAALAAVSHTSLCTKVRFLFPALARMIRGAKAQTAGA